MSEFLLILLTSQLLKRGWQKTCVLYFGQFTWMGFTPSYWSVICDFYFISWDILPFKQTKMGKNLHKAIQSCWPNKRHFVKLPNKIHFFLRTSVTKGPTDTAIVGVGLASLFWECESQSMRLAKRKKRQSHIFRKCHPKNFFFVMFKL